MIICPNCDSGLLDDEQLIIFHVRADGYFQVDHVKIFSQPDIKIEKICGSKTHNRLRID